MKKQVGKKTIPKVAKGGKTEHNLNFQQEAFCQSFALGDKDLFGNGVQCYLEVYGKEYFSTYKKQMSYPVAQVNASRLLSNAMIIDRINKLLESGGFTDQNVDKQHLFLINQHADLKTKLGAIKEYNSLKKRIDSNININNVVITEEVEKKVEDALLAFAKERNG